MQEDQIYHIDAIDGYKLLFESKLHVKAIVTDPPYKLHNVGGGKSKLKGLQKHESGLKHIEKSFDFEEHFKYWRMLCKPFNMFLFLSNKQISEFMHICEINNYVTTLLVWHKPDSVPFANNVWRPDAEYILHVKERGATFNGDAEQKKKIKTHNKVRSKHGHPTEKPEALIKELIQICSNHNDLILDPFIGSGTTAIAAMQSLRRFVGFEINKEYYLKALKRIDEESDKLPF